MRHAFWFLAFMLLLLAGDRLGGRVMQRQTDASQFRYSRLYNGRGEADIVLLGNSRGLTFYQPAIEGMTGLRSINLSYNGLPMDLAGVLLQDYLDRYPAPQKLLIDITLCDRDNRQLTAGFLPYAPQSQRLDLLIHHADTAAWYGARVSALFRFNNEVFQRALYYRQRSDADWLLDRVIAPELAAAAAQNRYEIEVEEKRIRALAETVAAAHAKGVQVELVIGPYFPGFQIIGLDALKNAAGQATGLPVRDYRAALNDPALFGDFMHPNKNGAIAYLELLQKDRVLPPPQSEAN
ncbi:MAG: hypothetical protein IT259_19490 [Saprospiraceae bacterium]|nr:hypothetical protein [Saprospiraceae bacterium]